MTFNQLFTAAALFSLCSIAHADIKDVIEKTYDFDKDGKIALSNVNGDVTISACDCSQVRLVATISASDQATRDRIKIDINDSNSRLTIKTKYLNSDHSGGNSNRHGRWNNNGHSEVTYEMSVPNGVSLDDIDLVNGDLNIKGVSGSLEADLVNGELESDGMTADTRVNMVNGDMNIKFANLNHVDKIKLESVNGDILVYLPTDANIDVSAETVSGHISNDFGIEVHKGRYVGSDMHGVIGDGSIKLSMQNVNGKIKLKTL